MSFAYRHGRREGLNNSNNDPSFSTFAMGQRRDAYEDHGGGRHVQAVPYRYTPTRTASPPRRSYASSQDPTRTSRDHRYQHPYEHPTGAGSSPSFDPYSKDRGAIRNRDTTSPLPELVESESSSLESSWKDGLHHPGGKNQYDEKGRSAVPYTVQRDAPPYPPQQPHARQLEPSHYSPPQQDQSQADHSRRYVESLNQRPSSLPDRAVARLPSQRTCSDESTDDERYYDNDPFRHGGTPMLRRQWSHLSGCSSSDEENHRMMDRKPPAQRRAGRRTSKRSPPPLQQQQQQQQQQPPVTTMTTNKQHQHHHHQSVIEVTPGLFMRLRGADETWEAIQKGYYVSSSCFACTLVIVCVADAAFVVCPMCRTLSPTSSSDESSQSADHTKEGGGAGLGFKLDDLLRLL